MGTVHLLPFLRAMKELLQTISSKMSPQLILRLPGVICHNPTVRPYPFVNTLNALSPFDIFKVKKTKPNKATISNYILKSYYEVHNRLCMFFSSLQRMWATEVTSSYTERINLCW